MIRSNHLCNHFKRETSAYFHSSQEKPTNCWTKAANLASKHNANPLNILVHLQLLGFHIHKTCQFKVLLYLLPSGCNLKKEFWDLQFWRYGYGTGIRTNCKPTHDFPIPNIKFWSICCRFAGMPMSNYGPPIRVWCVMVDLEGRKGYHLKCRPHILYTLLAYLAPFGHSTQRGRHRERSQ